MTAFEVHGLQETVAFFRALPALMEHAGVTAVEAVSQDAAARAVKNAPIRLGILRKNIKAGKVTVNRGTIKGGVGVYASGNYPKKYNGGKSFSYVAIRMHRYLMPHATSGGLYNLGPLSASQPGTPEGGVGGGFIERAVLQNAVAYGRMIDNIFLTTIAAKAP
jgi:hypothetical protein